MKCRQVADLISLYVDDALPADKAEMVRAHTADCAACRAELAAEHASVRALQSSRTTFDAPDVLTQIKRQAGEPRRQPARLRWQWAAGVAAACALVWFGITLNYEDVAPAKVATTPTVHSVQPSAPAPVPPAVRNDAPVPPPQRKSVARKAGEPRHPQYKRHVIRVPRPKPKPVERPSAPAAPEGQPAPEIEYLVVYNHSGLGGGIEPGEAVDATESGSESPAPSAYSISMTDESTGEVTSVSAYSSSGEEPEERATVKFHGSAEAPDRDERERSSTDEKPLYCAGGVDHSDRC